MDSSDLHDFAPTPVTVELEVPPIPTFAEGTCDLTDHGPHSPCEPALGYLEAPVDPPPIPPSSEVDAAEPSNFQGLGQTKLTAHSLAEVGPMASPIIIQITSTNPIWGEDPDLFWSKTRDEIHNTLKTCRSAGTIGEVVAGFQGKLENSRPDLLAFDDARFDSAHQFVVVPELANEHVWFIGDLHGDLLSYEILRNYIGRAQEAFGPGSGKICFLGDIVDDGPHDAELLCLILHSMLKAPGRFGFVTGNHDEGMYCETSTGELRSSVSPSDFCQRVNSQPAQSPMRALADVAIKFFRQAPRALLFADGLLVAHGGVPHVDLQGRIHQASDFNEPLMLADFVWTRMHESARRKIPNRTTRGCSLGFEDFDAFCEHAARVLGHPVRAMLRGHDHVPDRFLVHERYRRHPVVTINAMCRKQRGDVFGPFERKPVAVKWRAGHPLEIHQIEIPAWLIRHIYAPADEATEIAADPTHPPNHQL